MGEGELIVWMKQERINPDYESQARHLQEDDITVCCGGTKRECFAKDLRAIVKKK
jgi:hypothetical protein